MNKVQSNSLAGCISYREIGVAIVSGKQAILGDYNDFPTCKLFALSGRFVKLRFSKYFLYFAHGFWLQYLAFLILDSRFVSQ
jgi:hypothetical protein